MSVCPFETCYSRKVSQFLVKFSQTIYHLFYNNFVRVTLGDSLLLKEILVLIHIQIIVYFSFLLYFYLHGAIFNVCFELGCPRRHVIWRLTLGYINKINKALDEIYGNQECWHKFPRVLCFV